MKAKQIKKIITAIAELSRSESSESPGSCGHSGTMLHRMGFAERLGYARHPDGSRYIKFKVTKKGIDFASKNAALRSFKSSDSVAKKIEDVGEFKVLEYVPPICGVYFLMRGTEVVYVGQSADIMGRIKTHLESKQFDSVAYIDVEKSRLAEEELRWINHFEPVENRSCTRWVHTNKSRTLQSLESHRKEFGTPTILDLAISGEDKEHLANMGVFTVRKLVRNKELSLCFADAIRRFKAHREIV